MSKVTKQQWAAWFNEVMTPDMTEVWEEIFARKFASPVEIEDFFKRLICNGSTDSAND